MFRQLNKMLLILSTFGFLVGIALHFSFIIGLCESGQYLCRTHYRELGGAIVIHFFSLLIILGIILISPKRERYFFIDSYWFLFCCLFFNYNNLRASLYSTP